MAKRSNGPHKKARGILVSRNTRSLGSVYYDYTPGQRVRVLIDASVMGGLPHKRFHARVGTIVNNYVQSVTVSFENPLRMLSCSKRHILLL